MPNDGIKYCGGVTVAVQFSDFWNGFEPDDFLLPLFEQVTDRQFVVVQSASQANVVFHSGFSAKRIERIIPKLDHFRFLTKFGKNTQNQLHVWFSVENVRVPLANWDWSFSCEPDSQLNRNTYFAFWWLLFPELIDDGVTRRSAENRIGRELTLEECLTTRQVDTAQRPKFACAFISNPESTRMRLIRALSEIGMVDVFGLTEKTRVANKLEVATQYRYMVCLENSIYPGYVSEKPFDAWACGTIPIWQGIDNTRSLNNGALVDATGRSPEEIIQEILTLENSPNLLSKKANSPILLKRPDLSFLKQSLVDLLDSQNI